MSNLATHRRLSVWCSDWRIVAAVAGATYSVSLFGVATLLGIARNVWVEPLTDPDNALAIEAMVLLPCAWIICSTVAQAMRLSERMAAGRRHEHRDAFCCSRPPMPQSR